jgi:hypothetical protein
VLKPASLTLRRTKWHCSMIHLERNVCMPEC